VEILNTPLSCIDPAICCLFQHGVIQMAKQSTPKMSTLASRVLSGEKKATQADAKKLAASVLSQDETKGQRPPKKK
jgi:hypothetical protein